MKVFRGVPNIKGPSILMFGIFDGVHLAHQEIIHNALAQAEVEVAPAILYSFLLRPNEVLRGQKANMLTSEAQKLAILSKMGVDAACIVKFSKELASIPAEDWLDDICKKLKPSHIFVGFNYRFGFLGQGDKNMLIKYENKYGYKAHILEQMNLDDQYISSTTIRNCILNGDIENANKLLGREFTLPLVSCCEYSDRISVIKPKRMIKPAEGKYQAVLDYHYNGNSVVFDTVLNVDDSMYILKNDLPSGIVLPKKIAVSLSHRL